MASERDWLAVAERHRAGGRFDQALDALQQAIEEVGASVALLMGRGLVLACMGDYQAAVLDATKALTIEPESLGRIFQRARWSMKGGDFEAARADFTALLEARVPDAEYYRDPARLFRSFCLLKLGMGAEALEDALASADDAPFWATEELIDRAWLLEQAQALLRRGTRRRPH